jgi:hypothetical protein
MFIDFNLSSSVLFSKTNSILSKSAICLSNHSILDFIACCACSFVFSSGGGVDGTVLPVIKFISFKAS